MNDNGTDWTEWLRRVAEESWIAALFIEGITDNHFFTASINHWDAILNLDTHQVYTIMALENIHGIN